MLYEIHRYPADLIDVLNVTRDGQSHRVIVRPVLPQDDAPTADFFARLSWEARRLRFMAPVREVAPWLIKSFTRVDFKAHVALVAEVFEDGVETVIAEVRYVRDADGISAEFAVTVADGWQGLGIARQLLSKLVCHAQGAGVERLVGEALATNAAMLHLARRAGFVLTTEPDLRGHRASRAHSAGREEPQPVRRPRSLSSNAVFQASSDGGAPSCFQRSRRRASITMTAQITPRPAVSASTRNSTGAMIQIRKDVRATALPSSQ